jgi:hypothetical protein
LTFPPKDTPPINAKEVLVSVCPTAALVLCLPILLPALFPTHVSAETLVVDSAGSGGFLTIQAAVDSAAAGDSILVQAGVYEETVKVFPEKEGILIRGEPGPEFVTVQGDSITLGMWHVQTPVRVEGLTLTGGNVYGALFIMDSRAEFVNCIVRGNQGSGSCLGVGGGGQFLFNSDVLVEDCVFEQNRDWESPGGLIIWGSRADIRNNIFRENNACYGGGLEVYHCQQNTPSVIEGNLFLNNDADTWGGGILTIDSSPVIRNNTFVNNAGNNNASVYVLGGLPEITRNIFVGSPRGVTCAALSGYPASRPILGSNLIWDITDTAVYQCTQAGSFMKENPLFCSPDTGDYSLCSESPAVEKGAATYGALGVGCADCVSTDIENSTWGAIKTRYR